MEESVLILVFFKTNFWVSKILEIRVKYLSCVMRKPVFCICKNKSADQLHDNWAADQRICICY